MSLPGGALVVDNGMIVFVNQIAKELLDCEAGIDNLRNRRIFREYLTLKERAEILYEYTLSRMTID